MAINNKFTNTEEQLEKLREFQEQFDKTTVSFGYIYGENYNRKAKRDFFTPQNIEKLLTNVLLLKDLILEPGGLLDLARNKSVDIEKSIKYASTKQILKEVEKRRKIGHVWFETANSFERGKNININEGNEYLRSLEYDVEIADNSKDKSYFCYGCDSPGTTAGRSLCDKCLEEEQEVVKLEKGMPTKMERIECKECHEVYPVLQNRRKMIDLETKICWSCEKEAKENDDEGD